MLHDCFETFSHFVSLVFSNEKARNRHAESLKVLKNMFLRSFSFTLKHLKQGNEFFSIMHEIFCDDDDGQHRAW